MFHMGWFLNYRVHDWNAQWSGDIGENWVKPDLYIDLARAMERAGFDYMMLEDGAFIPDAYQGNADYYLRTAQHAPKHDPVTLVPLIAQATKHLGIIVTIATPFSPPFSAARLMATLDHISDGRVGINLVTAHNMRTAQNYGLDEHYPHDLRYEMADEWMDLVSQLWQSWEPDAVIADRDTGIYADHMKVRPVNFEGRFYKSRGPLNTIPSPQGSPVVCQAGASNSGRNLAAKYADTVVASVRGIEDMKEYRTDMNKRLVAHGRRPEDCKILYTLTPVFGETQKEAEAKQNRENQSTIEDALARLSWTSGIDFSKFDLDAPVPEIETQAAQSSTQSMLASDEPITLREIAERPVKKGSLEVYGTPDAVAAQLGEAMDEAGGDGFLITGHVSRRFISEVTDGLAPALRRRGLIRSEYTGATLRENLRAF